MTHIEQLESEAIFILREVLAQFENPCVLFSGGKDSAVILHLLCKALAPGKMFVPIVHIDTGHNFPEAIQYRDDMVKLVGGSLIVGSVEQTIKEGKAKEETGYYASRNKTQSITLLDTIEKYHFDCAIGGARRDEEKSRAKERIFSHRDEFGQWDPKNQRPELWQEYNGKKYPGEHFRVFPLSNWTELDVWEYIEKENVPLPSIYFTHKRKVFERDGQLLAADPDIILRKPTEEVTERDVRCRTVGDVTCTGLVESKADNVSDIIKEIKLSRKTERGGRADDKRSDTAMEDRKKVGYF